MKRLSYKNFSFKFHRKNWRKDSPNVCQFELTFRCPLRCRHCYSKCYDTPRHIRKELKTAEVIEILDKVCDSGVAWLCFTGGDPLAREDFTEIYAHARKKGFIITIFTSGALITEKIADFFKGSPPFCIEFTLNGITKKTYEDISGINGSYKSAMLGIARIKERALPFKIKTQVTLQNMREMTKIKDYTENLGLRFRPSFLLHAALNGDLTPCLFRLKPQDIPLVQEKLGDPAKGRTKPARANPRRRLFRCAAGSDTFHIDPYGNMSLCTALRKPSINIMENDMIDSFRLLKGLVAKKFVTNSRCKRCLVWRWCRACPGRALLEKGDAEAPVGYFCRLASILKEYGEKNQVGQARC